MIPEDRIAAAQAAAAIRGSARSDERRRPVLSAVDEKPHTSIAEGDGDVPPQTYREGADVRYEIVGGLGAGSNLELTAIVSQDTDAVIGRRRYVLI